MSIPPPLPKQNQPTVVLLFRIFCICFAAFLILGNLLSLATGPQLGLVDTALSAGDESLRDQILEEERREDRFMLIFSAILVPILLMGSALPARPWGHAYGFVVIIISSFLCLPIVFTIPLFIFWIKPETTRYFTRYGNAEKVGDGDAEEAV